MDRLFALGGVEPMNARRKVGGEPPVSGGHPFKKRRLVVFDPVRPAAAALTAPVSQPFQGDRHVEVEKESEIRFQTAGGLTIPKLHLRQPEATPVALIGDG